MTISFAEFEKLPKKNPIKTLTPGKKYYIEDTSRRNVNLKTVFIGIYTHHANGYNNFDEVEYVVAPFGVSGKPHGFNAKSGHKFMEAIDFNPTELDFKNKNRTISELHEFIHTKKAEPHDSTPPISFMGEDYRKAKHTFYNRSSSRSKSRSRSRSTSSTKKGGRKHPKRKTVRRHSRK
jgi:hypothetical protein